MGSEPAGLPRILAQPNLAHWSWADSWTVGSLRKFLLKVIPRDLTCSVWLFNPGNPTHGEWPLNNTPHPALSILWRKTTNSSNWDPFKVLSLPFLLTLLKGTALPPLLSYLFLCKGERSLVKPAWQCISHSSENWQRSSGLCLKLLKGIYHIHTNLLWHRQGS